MAQTDCQGHMVELDAIPTPTLVVDEAHHIIAINLATARLLGVSRDHYVAKHLKELLSRVSWFAVESMLSAALVNRLPIEQFSLRLKHVDGSEVAALLNAAWSQRTMYISLTPYDTRLTHERMVIAKRNEALQLLDQNREQEVLLKQKQSEQAELIRKLEEVNTEFVQTEKMAAIGQLAAGVAHEINNPIGYVYSNLRTLASYLDDLRQITDAIDAVDDVSALRKLKQTLDYDFLRSDVSNLLNESAQGIERVKHIITALKDFSRKDETELKLIDIHHALDTTLSVATNEIKYKAEVVKNYGEIPQVIGHLGQINQVLMNLLVNAAQAISGFGQITISTGVDGDSVWINIADNGAGITEAHLPRIFEPFYTTKPVGEGTGLGLALAYNIVRKHGGEIKVSTEVGKGSVFSVWLPIAGPKLLGSEGTPACQI